MVEGTAGLSQRKFCKGSYMGLVALGAGRQALLWELMGPRGLRQDHVPGAGHLRLAALLPVYLLFTWKPSAVCKHSAAW